jgi:hypothetical protein
MKRIMILAVLIIGFSSCTKDDGYPECKKGLTQEQLQKLVDEKKIM